MVLFWCRLSTTVTEWPDICPALSMILLTMYVSLPAFWITPMLLLLFFMLGEADETTTPTSKTITAVFLMIFVLSPWMPLQLFISDFPERRKFTQKIWLFFLIRKKWNSAHFLSKVAHYLSSKKPRAKSCQVGCKSIYFFQLQFGYFKHSLFTSFSRLVKEKNSRLTSVTFMTLYSLTYLYNDTADEIFKLCPFVIGNLIILCYEI